MAEYCELFRDFEMKKRKKSSLDERVILKVPAELNERFQAKQDKTIQNHLASSKYEKNIKCVKGKLILEPDVANTLFNNACVSAAYHLGLLFQDEKVKYVPTILMVGGFSECLMLQDAVKKALPGKQVVVPSEPGLVVLKGAVMFGHDPSVIQERRCRYTYGTGVAIAFREGVDPAGKKFVDGHGDVKCKDRFDIHVRMGEAVPSGTSTVTKTYTVLHTYQKQMNFDIFASDKKDPYFVTDIGCIKIGEFLIDIPGSGLDRSANLCLIFGDTEIHAEVIEGQSGKKSKATFKLLG